MKNVFPSHFRRRLKSRASAPEKKSMKSVERLLLKSLLPIALVAGTGCQRVSSWKATQASTLQSFTAAKTYDSTSAVYKLDYSFKIPTDAASQIDSISLREIDTKATSDVDCSSGITIQSWNGPFTAGKTIDGSYLSGKKIDRFKYIFCVNTTSGVTVPFQEGT